MDAIERREGLPPGECWVFREEGPDDYRVLEDQRDFATFDIQREIGSRVIYPREDPNSEVQQFIDGAIERDHGKEALDRIRNRVQEIQREVNL